MFLRLIARLRKKNWVVYAKPPFAGPAAVLAYLARYTHRVAISNRRLISLDESGVTFRYKDYRRDGAERYRTMTLGADEFIRRFLLHVLPKGFHRIRHYGLLASASRKANVARVRQLLAVPPAVEPAEPVEPADPRPPCPCCGGRMIIIEIFQRWMQPRAPPVCPAPTGTVTP
jgi:Putative transposase